jgi:hypothetical protein
MNRATTSVSIGAVHEVAQSCFDITPKKPEAHGLSVDSRDVQNAVKYDRPVEKWSEERRMETIIGRESRKNG